MKYRVLGKTGYEVSEVSFGAWAIGGTWGNVDDKTSMKALETAIDEGVNFFDTADVYGDGRSERLLGQLKKSKKDHIYIATKAGRRLDPHTSKGYNVENITRFVERSLTNLEVEQIDLLQLHCPPTEVYHNVRFFENLNQLIDSGKVAHIGVSVETVSEALRAMKYDNISTVQIIFNMFRMKPAEHFLMKAQKYNVGVIARVPLSSGMLTGKMNSDTHFDKSDHRSFNRNGEAFDKGETFSGVPYEVGLKAVEALKKIKPESISMAQFALAWILQHEAVSCTIPGGKTPEQVSQNCSSSGVIIDKNVMNQVKTIYDDMVSSYVHHLW